MSLLEDVKRKAKQLPARLGALDKELQAIAKKLQKLEQMGLERGKAHWRKEGKKPICIWFTQWKKARGQGSMWAVIRRR